MKTVDHIMQGINSIEELELIGDPCAIILSFQVKKKYSGSMNILVIADVMEEKFGWRMERNQFPPCIHCTIMPQHSKVREKFVSDLRESVNVVKTDPNSEYIKAGSAAIYGMTAQIPDPRVLSAFLYSFMDYVYK